MKAARNKLILVVDDEVHMREIVAFDLEREGYRVLHAENGKVAFDVVQRERPDLVISDVRMPQWSGVDLLKNLRATNPATPPFIFMTAFSDISADLAMDMGAEDFLTKPLDHATLLATVHKAIQDRTKLWAQTTYEMEDLRELVRRGTPLLPLPASAAPTLGRGGLFWPLEGDFPECLEIIRFETTCRELGDTPLKGIGRVRWVRHDASDELPAGLGLEFLQLTPEATAKMQAVTPHLTVRSYIPLGGPSDDT